MTDGSLRLFFAVPLIPGLQGQLAELQERLQAARAKVKWVEPENLHFTLKFLGDTPADQVERLAQTAQTVAARHESFRLELSGVGGFPHVRRPRVVWVGSSAGAEQLAALAADLEQSLVAEKLAEPENRPFSAHLTLGRVKAPVGLEQLEPLLGAEELTRVGEMLCDHFVLFRSDLRPTGPIYTEVQRFSLTGTAS